MLLKLESIQRTDMHNVEVFFLKHGIIPTPKVFTSTWEKRTVQCFEFELPLLGKFIEAFPQFVGRPHCFDASKDIVDCWAGASDESALLGVHFDLMDIDEPPFKLGYWQFAELLQDCNFGQVEGNGSMWLKCDECVGRQFDGEEIWQSQYFNAYDWIVSFGHNEKDIRQIVVAYLLRFGLEWLKTQAQNV